MLQKTTFLRCTAGGSVRSRSQAHLQPVAASECPADLGVKAKHGKGRGAKSLASRLLQPPPHTQPWVSVVCPGPEASLPFLASNVSQPLPQCRSGNVAYSQVALPGVKKIKSSVLEEHGRQNHRKKAWLQGSQRDADICACQNFFMAAVIVDIYFSSLQWSSVC